MPQVIYRKSAQPQRKESLGIIARLCEKIAAAENDDASQKKTVGLNLCKALSINLPFGKSNAFGFQPAFIKLNSKFAKLSSTFRGNLANATAGRLLRHVVVIVGSSLSPCRSAGNLSRSCPLRGGTRKP